MHAGIPALRPTYMQARPRSNRRPGHLMP
jgi:hypothetical protein